MKIGEKYFSKKKQTKTKIAYNISISPKFWLHSCTCSKSRAKWWKTCVPSLSLLNKQNATSEWLALNCKELGLYHKVIISTVNLTCDKWVSNTALYKEKFPNGKKQTTKCVLALYHQARCERKIMKNTSLMMKYEMCNRNIASNTVFSAAVVAT